MCERVSERACEFTKCEKRRDKVGNSSAKENVADARKCGAPGAGAETDAMRRTPGLATSAGEEQHRGARKLVAACEEERELLGVDGERDALQALF